MAGVVARTTVHVVEASKRVPLLIAVLSAVLLLPAVALASYLLQSRARRRRELAANFAAEARAGIADTTRESADAAAPLWPHQAWLSLEDAKTVPLAGQVIRIGRDRENDIRLPDASVHRYHAVIEHTPEEAFVITDLSGKDGNGLRVNGKKLISGRACRWRLDRARADTTAIRERTGLSRGRGSWKHAIEATRRDP